MALIPKVMKGMTFDRFEEIFNNLEDCKKVQLWNDLCDENGNEEKLYSMDDVDELLAGRTPSELLVLAENNFSLMDDYFFFNRCGRIASVGYLENFFEETDIEDIYDRLEREGCVEEWAKENDPDYNEEDWQ